MNHPQALIPNQNQRIKKNKYQEGVLIFEYLFSMLGLDSYGMMLAE